MEALSDTRVVVALDFGTTFSGFSYARKSEPDNVFNFYDWPCQAKAGGKPYCKTQTSLFYVSGSDGNWELKDWGWSAFVSYTKALQELHSLERRRHEAPESSNRGGAGAARVHRSFDMVSGSSSEITNKMFSKVGFFVTKFKLHLAVNYPIQMDELPGDLTVERLISDYLRCISSFALAELRTHYGKHFNKKSIQWCITVPAIWNERAKQVMRICAQKAGLVTGPLCTVDDASPHEIFLALEPEAAAAYCQKTAKRLCLKKGDRIMIADVGGGTIDIVVHSKADDDPNSMRVAEAAGSYGDLGGGSFVDKHFFDFMSRKIGCFKEFCQVYPSVALNILGWWQGIKAGFDGMGYSAELQLPAKLSAAWEEHDERGRGEKETVSVDDYSELELLDSDMMQIFDPEVEKVVKLIEEQILGVRVVMVVGGFSASPYLRKILKRKFEKKVEVLIIPDEPGSAICNGAVRLQLQMKELILSRIARRTYGIDTSRPFQPLSDPVEKRFYDDEGLAHCVYFDVFVRAGESVPVDHSVTRDYYPVYHAQRSIVIELYSTIKVDPRYPTEDHVVSEGKFKIDISDGLALDKERRVEVRMHFGRSSVEVKAVRKNFGNRDEVEGMLPVAFV